jgi:hypothetical protein
MGGCALALFLTAGTARASDLSDPAAGIAVGAGSIGGGFAGGLLGAFTGAAIFASTSQDPNFDAGLAGFFIGGALGAAAGEFGGAALTSRAVHRRSGPTLAGGLIGLAVGATVTTLGAVTESDPITGVGGFMLVVGVPVGAGVGAAVGGERVSILPDVRPGFRGIHVGVRF